MKSIKSIIRCKNAGVFFARVAERRGSEADLEEARRIWSWDGATDCIGLAVNGLNPNTSRLTVSVRSMTVMDVLEIIPCTEKASEIIEGVKAWTA